MRQSEYTGYFYLEPANGDILFIAKPKTDDVEHGGKERSDPAISVRARRFKEGFLFDSLITQYLEQP